MLIQIFVLSKLLITEKTRHFIRLIRDKMNCNDSSVPTSQNKLTVVIPDHTASTVYFAVVSVQFFGIVLEKSCLSSRVFN